MKISLISTSTIRPFRARPILLACLFAATAGQVHAQSYADVSGALSIASTSLSVGGTDVITATLTNADNSTETALDINFSDTLPDGLKPTGFTAVCGGGARTGQTITDFIPSLNPGASCTVQIDITGELAGTYSDTGTFSTSTANRSGGTTGTTNTVPIDVTPSPAPEPATWAMMLAGFGGMGAVLRTRRRRVTA